MSGGKWTTLRLMAQDIVDAMCRQLEVDRPCRTTEELPPGNEDGTHYLMGTRLRRREETLRDEPLICECELIGRSKLEEVMRRRGTTDLDDIRRSLRLGMGPCQGGFCIYRATGILHEVERLDGEEASSSLLGFLQERWKGMWPILYGDQLRQARFDDWVFQGLLDVEHLPDAVPAVEAPGAEPAPA
jgi:glycerol-3-phosphate dehydrogenase